MDKEVKQLLNTILNKIETMDYRIETMDKKIETMDKKIETMDKNIATLDKRQEETYKIVKAIEHANEVHKAEIDNLNNKNAKLEGTFNKISHVINEEIA